MTEQYVQKLKTYLPDWNIAFADHKATLTKDDVSLCLGRKVYPEGGAYYELTDGIEPFQYDPEMTPLPLVAEMARRMYKKAHGQI